MNIFFIYFCSAQRERQAKYALLAQEGPRNAQARLKHEKYLVRSILGPLYRMYIFLNTISVCFDGTTVVVQHAVGSIQRQAGAAAEGATESGEKHSHAPKVHLSSLFSSMVRTFEFAMSV